MIFFSCSYVVFTARMFMKHSPFPHSGMSAAISFQSKGNSSIFKPGPYTDIFWCVNYSYLPNVSESVQQIASAGS